MRTKQWLFYSVTVVLYTIDSLSYFGVAHNNEMFSRYYAIADEIRSDSYKKIDKRCS